ncbi:basic helix-loop-helix protein [Xylographa vitiligo]|nr:basic helix-loop-helix protein [Xylographa vitiligo]
MPNQLNYPDEERARIHEDISEVIQSMVSKKRKRGSMDQNGDEIGSKRGSLTNMNGNGDHMNGSSGESFSDNSNEFAALHQQLQNVAHAQIDASSTAAAALAAHLGGPETSTLSFVSQGTGTDGERQMDTSFDLGGSDVVQNHNPNSAYNLGPFTSVGGTAAQVQAAREASNNGAMKPAVGTDEWHKVRRDNHKEGSFFPPSLPCDIHTRDAYPVIVERRRRETINEGINELAKIVPGCEKNKGSILQRAVNYIMDLKRQQDDFVDKRTLEKVVLEQALAELTNQNEVYKEGMQKAWQENEKLKARLRSHGIGEDDGEEISADGESE